MNIICRFVVFMRSGQQLWQRCQDEGFLFTLITQIQGLIPERILHTKGCILYALEPQVQETSQAVALGVRTATPDDLALLTQCGYIEPQLAYWFEKGVSAWLIERDGKLLGCYWLDGGRDYDLYDCSYPFSSSEGSESLYSD